MHFFGVPDAARFLIGITDQELHSGHNRLSISSYVALLLALVHDPNDRLEGNREEHNMYGVHGTGRLWPGAFPRAGSGLRRRSPDGLGDRALCNNTGGATVHY